ncbi:MAG: PAS domain-containing protein, partial [Chitinophagaceae bacterium]
MQHSTDPLFQSIYDQLKDPSLVLARVEGVPTVITANIAFEKMTGFTREQLMGKQLFELVDHAKDSGRKFETTLNGVFEDRLEAVLPLTQYAIRIKEDVSISQFWQLSLSPVLSDKASVAYVNCLIRNYNYRPEQTKALEYLLEKMSEDAAYSAGIQSALRESQSALAELKGRLGSERAVTENELRLYKMVMSTPIGLCILKGRDLVIDVANTHMLNIWQRTLDQVLDQPLLKIFPELRGQEYPNMLVKVFDTGEEIALPEMPAVIGMRDGSLSEIMVNFSYRPLFNEAGAVE